MSNLTGVTTYFSTANEGFNTTTSSAVSSGASSVPLTNMSTLVDGSVFVGIIEPGTGNEQTFTGTVDLASTSILNVHWTRGNNVAHAGGVTVVDYVTGSDWNMMITGILKSLTQSGALNAAALAQVYPIGCIYTTTVGTNPSTIFGFGTWVATGAGRVLMGNGTSDATYAAGTTGGASSSTHWHWQTVGADAGAIYAENGGSGSGRTRVITVNRTSAGASSNSVDGSREDGTYDATVNTVPPYLVVYFWKRTA